MKGTIYMVVQSFSQNKGSFSGFIEKLSIHAHKEGYNIIILCAIKKGQKKKEKLPYAQVIRFSTPDYPLFANLFKAIALSKKIKKYLKMYPPKEGDMFLANGEAALGITDRKFVHRGGDQPALTFLRNMEIAKDEVSLKTRIARFFHLYFQYLLEKKYMKHSHALIYSSRQAAENFFNYYGGSHKPLFIPHAGVSYDEIKNAKPKKIPGIKMMFVAANNEEIRKGTVYLRKAMPKLFDKHKDLKLIHLGDKYNYDLKRYEDRIIMPGRVPWEEMKTYYKTADIFLNCSLSEAFPIAIFEAMASGTPVITSDIDGAHEYISHKESGYIYKRGNVKEMIDGIDYMIKNPKKRKQMADISQERVRPLAQKNYNDELLKYIVNVYHSKTPIQKNLLL